MGMDNNFFKIKKNDFRENRELISEFIYSLGNLDKYCLTAFRNNYILDEVIKGEFKGKFEDCIRISKKELKDIIDVLYIKFKEYDFEKEFYDWTKVNEAVEKLEIIYKLFNFKQDYLIYDCIG